MPFPYAPKIWSWRIFGKSAYSSRGVMTLLAAFLAVIFAIVGLGILHLSHIHMRLTAHKKHSELLDYAAENGLKSGFTRLLDILEAAPSPIPLTDQGYALLASDIQNQGIEAVKTLFAQDIPRLLSGGTSEQFWQNHIQFSLLRWIPFDLYFTAEYTGNIQTSAGIRNSSSQRNAALEASLDLRVGRIPLPLLPVLVGKDMNIPDAQEFLEANQISFAETEQLTMVPPQLLTGEGQLMGSADGLLLKALKIDIFRPQDLTPASLRQAIGLEPSPDPVPDGVYLIQDDLGLGGVYVQGDLTRLVLAIESDYQVVAFWQGEEHWILKYDPSASHTRFITPTGEQSFDLIPLGIIIIDGKVESLSAGIMDGSEAPTPITDEELPCIRRGIDLTIVSSDSITLTSHLIHQGVKWQDGVPYAVNSDSQLHLLAAGNNMMGDDSGSGKIIIANEAPEQLKLQGTITAAEEGITIEGQGKSVDLLGSIHFPEYESNDNSLRLHLDTRLLGDESLIRNAPHTRDPVLMLSGFRAALWTMRI